MGEPSQDKLPLVPLPPDELTTMFRRQYPQAVLDFVDGQYIALTVHGVGHSENEAMQHSLTEFEEMKRDGQSVRQILDDVLADLKLKSGMSRERHDSLQELLTIAEKALNDGVLTKTVPWIMTPSLTREIEALRKRVETRLNMQAQELQEREKAKSRASQKFPRTQAPEDGLTPYQRLQARIKP